MLLSKNFWKPVLWWNVKMTNIEYYDIQYAPDRTTIGISGKWMILWIGCLRKILQFFLIFCRFWSRAKRRPSINTKVLIKLGQSLLAVLLEFLEWRGSKKWNDSIFGIKWFLSESNDSSIKKTTTKPLPHL